MLPPNLEQLREELEHDHNLNDEERAVLHSLRQLDGSPLVRQFLEIGFIPNRTARTSPSSGRCPRCGKPV